MFGEVELAAEPRVASAPPVDAGIDYLALGRELSRSQFLERCPFLFLYGHPSLARPEKPQATIVPRVGGRSPLATIRRDAREVAATPLAPAAAVLLADAQIPPSLFAVRKVQPVFPSMITLGRTHNNDIVVPDESLSRVHSYFRLCGEHVELFDAGSTNGTWVGPDRLAPRGPGVKVEIGATLRFGPLRLALLRPSACWALLHMPGR